MPLLPSQAVVISMLGLPRLAVYDRICKSILGATRRCSRSFSSR
jgi:hypothetical protein